jgi:hypothetical protein
MPRTPPLRFPVHIRPFQGPRWSVSDSRRHLVLHRRGLGLLIGASSVVDPWASFFDEVPWGQRSPGFFQDRVALAGDARRAWNASEAELSEEQGRLFDPEAVNEH